MHFIPIDKAMDQAEPSMEAIFDNIADQEQEEYPLSSLFLSSTATIRPPTNVSSFEDTPLCNLFSSLETQEIRSTIFDMPFRDQTLEPRPLQVFPSCDTTATTATPATPATRPLSRNPSHESSSASLRSLINFVLGSSETNLSPALKQTLVSSHSSSQQKEQKRRPRTSEEQGNTTTAATAATTSKLATFRPHQDASWCYHLKKLQHFKLQHGHCCIPISYTEDLMLARWVKRQRYQYKRYQDGESAPAIDEMRIDKLENIGFVWDAHAAQWQEKWHELAAYVKERGHCNIPTCDPENPKLATWMKLQRRQYKLLQLGRPSNMTQERIKALDSLGFMWTLRTAKYCKIFLATKNHMRMELKSWEVGPSVCTQRRKDRFWEVLGVLRCKREGIHIHV